MSETGTYHRLKGDLKISGVLQYSIARIGADFTKNGFYFFDESYYKLIPKNIPYASQRRKYAR